MLNALDELQADGWMPDLGPEVFDIHTPEGNEQLPPEQRLRHWVEQASRVIPRVGPYDWRLHMLRRWGGKRGFYAVEFLDRLAAKWDTEGRLRYGSEGYDSARFDWRTVTPEIEGLVPYDGDETAEEWA